MEHTISAEELSAIASHEGLSDKRRQEIAQQGQILGIIHIVMGILTCLVGLAFLIYVAVGVTFIVVGVTAPSSQPGPPEWMMGAIFTVIGLFALIICEVIGGLTIFAGRGFMTARHHTFLVVVQCLNLLNQPLGMILGAFGLLYLFNKDVRMVFKGEDGDPDILV